MNIATEATPRTICSSCQAAIGAEEESITCSNCGGRTHQNCWEHDGRLCMSPECISARLKYYAAPAEAHALPLPAAATPENDRALWFSVTIGIIVLVATAVLAFKLGVPSNTIMVLAVVIAALSFDYVNGMHDAGNAIATVISTRVLTPFAALLMAAILNLVGALFFSGVAKSIATKFADMQQVATLNLHIAPVMILCGLIGASAWSFLTARWGVPVSTSHSLFGGLIGVFLISGIPLNHPYMILLATFMVAAPLTAFIAGYIVMILITWIFRHAAPHRLNKGFRIAQFISSASVAFSHGANDAQKAMGIITLALVSGGFIDVADISHVEVPIWVKVACALVIALGTGFGGMRVIRTLGHKIIKLAPVHGFAAESVAAATIQVVTHLGVPVSTTHIISSSILGIGASRRLSSVRWGLAMNIVLAWIVTIPTAAAASALLYWIVKIVFHLH